MNLGIAPSFSGSVQSSTASSFSRFPQGSPASVLRRARLDPGVVDEKLLVQRDEVFRLFRRLVLGEDRLHRAHGLAGPAVDALVGVDEELVGPLVDAIHWADLDAGLVLDVDARLDDHVRHRISPLYRAGPASFGELWPAHSSFKVGKGRRDGDQLCRSHAGAATCAGAPAYHNRLA